jgi:hypothetical protein
MPVTAVMRRNRKELCAQLEGVTELNQKLLIAKRHFPARSSAIELLAGRDEDFLALCIDLADAEAEVLRWQNDVSPKRDQRLAVYVELVRDLAAEIEVALDRATIIALSDRRPKEPR